MIVGLGVDIVDLERFAAALASAPRLRERLFAESERGLSVRSLAGRFAAKEALIKALGSSEGVRWHDMPVTADAEGAPAFRLTGGVAELAARRGATRTHLTISHDRGVAVAVVVAEG